MSNVFLDEERTERVSAPGVITLDRDTCASIARSILNPVAEKLLDDIQAQRADLNREIQAALREVREGLERMETTYERCVNLKFQMLDIVGKNMTEVE